METNKIIWGDCTIELKDLPDESVDAIITDPPYGLEFMGKDWDKFKDGKNIAGGTTGIDTPFGRSKAMLSFYQMNKRFGVKGQEGENDLKVKKNFEVLPRFFKSDLLTFQEFTTDWARECLRVLKPGGYLLSFGGTRTYHRMACAIEDAGFEIRDMIEWVYGSGFPKSLNIGKQIDKLQGNEREVVGNYVAPDGNERHNNKIGKEYETEMVTGFKTDRTKDKGFSEWEGWGTALKPAHEPIVVARKPLSEKTVAENVLKYGTGGINIDESRVGTEEHRVNVNDFSNQHGNKFGNGESINKLGERMVTGRFPANLLWSHHPDCKKIGYKEVTCNSHYPDMNVTGYGKNYGGKTEYIAEGERVKSEQVENWECVDGCPTKEFEKAGNCGGDSRKSKLTYDKGIWGNAKSVISNALYNDSGTPARFFKSCPFELEDYAPFYYTAKASKSERNEGCEELPETYMDVDGEGRNQAGFNSDDRKPMLPRKNNHPTVKPIKLMEYLIKLVSREGAIILDPFLGSGTTAVACLKTNRQFIGIEKEDEYIKIAEARIKPFMEQVTL